VGIPSWLSPSGHTDGLDYQKEIHGIVAMMPLTIWASLSSIKEKNLHSPLLLVINLCVYINTPCYNKLLLFVLKDKCRSA